MVCSVCNAESVIKKVSILNYKLFIGFRNLVIGLAVDEKNDAIFITSGERLCGFFCVLYFLALLELCLIILKYSLGSFWMVSNCFFERLLKKLHVRVRKVNKCRYCRIWKLILYLCKSWKNFDSFLYVL